MVRLSETCCAAAVLVAITTSSTARAEWTVDSRGEMGLETRVFTPDDDSGTQDQNVAAAARLQVDAKEGPFRLRFRGFVRHDETDRGRSAAFPEEAWAQWRGDRFSLTVGWDMVTWTATEAFHPADVINSRYFDSNVEGFEKIGEPLAQLRMKLGQGAVSAYFMPFFTSPIFPSPRSRLSFTGPGVPFGKSLWLNRDGEISDGRWGAQWAANVQQTVGDADISVHVLQNQDRYNPVVGIDPTQGKLRPLFAPLTQVGGTYQQVVEGVILKAELAYRMFADPTTGPSANFVALDERQLSESRDHGAVAVGLEYAVSLENGWESTFIVEGQTIFAEGKGWRGNERIRHQLNLFQRDLMGGIRLAFQDVADSALLLFAIVDLESPEQVFGNLAYTRRIGEEWSLKTGIRFFNLPPKDPRNPVGFERWHQANQLSLTLMRHF